MSCPPPSVSSYACFTHAKQQARSQAPPRRRRTRPTKKTKKEPPKPEEAKTEGVGCESGTYTIPEFTDFNRNLV